MASGNLNTDNQNLGPKAAAQVHPLYSLLRPTWEQLAHVREGTGGFLDGTYLVAHPREYLDHTIVTTDTATGATVSRTNPSPRSPSPKLLARRRLARYENVASSIIEAKKSALFREQPTRRVGEQVPVKPQTPPVQAQADPVADPTSDPSTTKKPVQMAAPPPAEPAPESELEQWWEDVDGDDTHIDDAMAAWWDLAATFGHVVLYLDISAPADEPATAADQPSPYVRLYTPLDVLDWRRNDQGCLVWVKLLEATQPEFLGTVGDARSVVTYRIRVVDETSWSLYDFKTGKFISRGPHGFGRLPVVYLFAKRRALLSDIGESVLGDPRNYIDLYNLTSEVRELLRGQTFSFINLPLGTGPDAMSVESAQAMMGQQTGTMNVLFSGGDAKILTGDPANVTSYHDEISRVKREIYREAGVQWATDSKDAEAANSLELKQDEMNVRLSAYADECQQAEYALADLWYRARYGEDLGPTKLEEAQVVIHYPEHFTATPFDEVLKQVQAAQSIGMPALFLKELRKAIVAKFEGMANLTPEMMRQINEAIDTAADDPTPAERMKQKMDVLAVAAGGTPGKRVGKPVLGKDGKMPTQLDPEKAA
jgi:hypothetical protein